MNGYIPLNDNTYGLPEDDGLSDAVANTIDNMTENEIQEYREMYLESLAGEEYKEDDFMLWLDDIIADHILNQEP